MIVHFDLDAFYASVAQRDDPSLRGVPLAVSGQSRRAVVLTASYEARPFGVRSAMPLYRALELCPHLTVVRPDFTAYRESSRARVRDLRRRCARGRRALARRGVRATCRPTISTRRSRSRSACARAIRDEVGLTASAGVASVKMVAKIASDVNKPERPDRRPAGHRGGVSRADAGRAAVGDRPKTQPRLEAAGIRTIGDVAVLDDARLYELFGRGGTFYRDLARGIDDREVDPSRERKSISTEETFEYDERDEARILALLRVQADELARDLQKEQLRGATVGVKIKKADHTITGRQTSLAVATNDAEAIHDAAVWCWQRSGMAGVPIRLLGTRVASLTDEEARELRLF